MRRSHEQIAEVADRAVLDIVHVPKAPERLLIKRVVEVSVIVDVAVKGCNTSPARRAYWHLSRRPGQVGWAAADTRFSLTRNAAE